MPLDLSRIRALCFDVDGTLSNTDDLYAQRIARTLRPLRLIFRHRDHRRAARRLVMWAEAPGNALMGLPDILGLDDELLGLVEWLNRKRSRPMKHFLIVPGVKEALERLHGGYLLAVVSARDHRSTLDFLEQYGLSRLFYPIVTAVTVGHTKPFPDPVLYAAQQMGVPPRNCLMIGDTTVDIRAGRAAGAQTVGVLCGFGQEPELRRRGADLILDSTADLADVLMPN
jgi:phosphoglycolate phosphatase-like HAD superfamily hydrolase